ncbi:hypothetical protein [Ascidiaceihabitans sp.]|uniref:hypothetical protein n=1 Tax=Ascidiaceihabitans sp. TaxID=1872644 RepID=UPI003298553C
MPTVTPASFTARGWREHYSGFPADLFFAAGVGEPWALTPHLHVNYAIGGALQSMTYKNAVGQNTYLFQNGMWNDANISLFAASPLQPEIAFARALA